MKRSNKQGGFGLTSVMMAILVSTVLGALAAGKFATVVNDTAAEATGTYLLAVRGAVLKTLSEHTHAYTNVNTATAPSGTYPTAPAWATFTGATRTISVPDLKAAGLLRSDFPDFPPLGRSAHIQFRRTGTCPGSTCQVEAVIYTCWPISATRPVGAVDVTTCPAAPAGMGFEASLAGRVVMATEGHGASNTVYPARLTGTLFNATTASLGLPAGSAGHVAVLASLNNTLFNQFVRQGDTRHIYLNDRLTVEGVAQSNTGFLSNTAAAVGGACTEEGVMAMSSRQSLLMCKGGSWFEYTNHIVTSSQEIPHGGTATAPFCPGANLQPFYMASLKNTDITVTGSNINVRGTHDGTITGSGWTNAQGRVSVNGTFSGTFASQPTSSIRVAQSVTVNPTTRVVTISPNGFGARALVVAGCRTI